MASCHTPFLVCPSLWSWSAIEACVHLWLRWLADLSRQSSNSFFFLHQRRKRFESADLQMICPSLPKRLCKILLETIVSKNRQFEKCPKTCLLGVQILEIYLSIRFLVSVFFCLDTKMWLTSLFTGEPAPPGFFLFCLSYLLSSFFEVSVFFV